MTQLSRHDVARIARRLAPVAADSARLTLTLRPDQVPPGGKWRLWLMLAGRGWGKSQALTGLVDHWASEFPGCRIVLAARTAADVRDTMLYGPSGVMTCSTRPPRHVRNESRLEWENGSIAELKSADETRQGRGPGYHFGAFDELMAWNHPERPGGLYSNLRQAIRLPGLPTWVDYPGTQIGIATTPLPNPLLRQLVDRSKGDSLVRVTRGRTFDNIANLDADYIAETQLLAGTRWARQENEGEILEDGESAFWSLDKNIAPHRVWAGAGSYAYKVVGVDPSVGRGTGDACGIVVAGVAADGHVYVLGDYTLNGPPIEWARKVVWAWKEHGAHAIVAEGNQGGELIATTIKGIDARAPVQIEHATVGKRARAEPLAVLYDRGFVHHVGEYRDLEAEMTRWEPFGDGPSPNRIDALVWACEPLIPHAHRAIFDDAKEADAKRRASDPVEQARADQEAFHKHRTRQMRQQARGWRA